MADIVDKGLLAAIGTLLAFQGNRLAAPVLAMLLCIIAASLESYFTNQRIKEICILAFILCCFILPELIYFLPVLFYDCGRERFYGGILGVVPVVMVYQNSNPQPIHEFLWIWTGISLAAVLLGTRTERMENLEKEMIRLRDTSTELNLVLQEKNKNLMEKQDYEIYLATLRERNRIAREIHDNVGHMLSRSILQMGALSTIHKEEPLHGGLDSVTETLNQAMNSIRESVHDLHDDSVDLRQAVKEAAKDMQKNYKVMIDYDIAEEVPRNVKFCFITIVKEAMSNIVKHSNADKIIIVLREHPGFYQLSVEDNGTVREECKGQKSGIGISNMRERVETLNGTFRIHKEKGFQIFISIPKVPIRL